MRRAGKRSPGGCHELAPQCERSRPANQAQRENVAFALLCDTGAFDGIAEGRSCAGHQTVTTRFMRFAIALGAPLEQHGQVLGGLIKAVHRDARQRMKVAAMLTLHVAAARREARRSPPSVRDASRASDLGAPAEGVGEMADRRAEARLELLASGLHLASYLFIAFVR